MIRRDDERGSALLVALLILLLAFLVLMAVTARVSASSRALSNAQKDLRALNAAEAGLATAVQRLAVDDDPDTAAPVALGRSAWEVESRRRGARGPWRRFELTVRGHDGGRTVVLLAIVDARLPPPGQLQVPGRVLLRSWERRARGSE